VITRKLNSSAYIKAELEGDYHMMFTRTWGAPYDPHSYLNSWGVPSHVEYSAVGDLEPPLTRAILLKKISDVQVKTDPLQIAKGWEEILNDIHQQA
jgi:nickel transport system substrate-binding protein